MLIKNNFGKSYKDISDEKFVKWLLISQKYKWVNERKSINRIREEISCVRPSCIKLLIKSKYVINKQISCQAKLKKLIHLIPFSTIKYYLKIEYTHVSKYMLTLEKKKTY